MLTFDKPVEHVCGAKGSAATPLITIVRVQPGDCVVLNAATSTVGQAVIQICRTLQLRTVAVVADHGSFEKTDLWLKSLGATVVLNDKGSLKVPTAIPSKSGNALPVKVRFRTWTGHCSAICPPLRQIELEENVLCG
jgi:NADPH:quinone reductase-like Zn-dependent oxidoreductase